MVQGRPGLVASYRLTALYVQAQAGARVERCFTSGAAGAECQSGFADEPGVEALDVTIGGGGEVERLRRLRQQLGFIDDSRVSALVFDHCCEAP